MLRRAFPRSPTSCPMWDSEVVASINYWPTPTIQQNSSHLGSLPYQNIPILISSLFSKLWRVQLLSVKPLHKITKGTISGVIRPICIKWLLSTSWKQVEEEKVESSRANVVLKAAPWLSESLGWSRGSLPTSRPFHFIFDAKEYRKEMEGNR